MLFDALLATVAVTIALALRPWRAVAPPGPPWPWLAWWAVLPLLWGIDRITQSPLVQPLSGACLLMLMCGWPLAVLAFVPAAILTALAGDLGPAEALQRGVWLGLLPATLAMGLGAAVRRWLPKQLFIYILGRAFLVTAIAGMVSGVGSVWLQRMPSGLQSADLMLARALAGFGDAFLTGMLVAIFVAFRPQWLATYNDRIYLVPGAKE